MKWLWPIATGRTFFDGPSVFHLSFWLFLGSCLAYAKVSLNRAMLGMLAGAFTWEIFERYAEKRWPAFWPHPEVWFNSWVSDPLTGVVGVLLAYWLVRHG